MTATSVTGKGVGSSNKLTTVELATLANGPSIIFTGRVESEATLSPGGSACAIVFPYPLPGSAEDYVVMLTTVNAGSAYVASEDETATHFTGVQVIGTSEGTIMYMVAKVGSRPNI